MSTGVQKGHEYKDYNRSTEGAGVLGVQVHEYRSTEGAGVLGVQVYEYRRGKW